MSDVISGGARGDDPTHAQPASRETNHTIGAYRLIHRLGEGGMGEVWLAEQTRPVRRQVALKIIKAGMDTAQVVARFEAERQALALMSHPAIAQVFDAGTTPQGRPYFAMEYVRGEPITTYCTRHRLSTRRRIDLFLEVCDGVQHAHQKGVIHRDLKPSNILVTVLDDRPVPKIIDFGVAKATTRHLTDYTLVTELGALVGTPEYMSPEQAEMGGLDVDTRTDVYALGAILYELLTGVLPFDSRTLRAKPLDDLRRTIREVEPQRPSTRATALAASAGRIGTNPTPAGELRGDLDAITMHALEKDRTRRYGSASDLAADLRRHLEHQPVLATPPRTVYRIGKFVRRHRLGVSAVAAVSLLTVAFAATMTIEARQIARQRDRAVAAERRSSQETEVARQVSAFLINLFNVSDPSESRGGQITAREILDRGAARIRSDLSGQPTVQARLMATMGRVYQNLGLFSESRPLLEEALRIRRQEAAGPRRELAESLDDLGSLMFQAGDLGNAETALREALAVYRRTAGDDDPDAAGTASHLAMVIRRKETPEAIAEAEALYRSALATRRKLHAPDDRAVAESLNDLGLLLAQNKRDYAAAEPLFREALAINRRVFGNTHLEVSITLNNLGLMLRDAGRYADAEPVLREGLAIDRQILPANHPGLAVVLNNLANLLQRKGDLGGAESFYREALAQQKKVFPDSHWEVATVESLLGACLTLAKRYGEAEPLVLHAYPIIRANFGDAHPRTRVALRRIVELYDAWGKPRAAADWRARSPKDSAVRSASR